MHIAHISDTHFGTETPVVMEALKHELAAHNTDVVILSGDITQRARPSQFAAARAFMHSLPGMQKLVIPGNHDIPLYNLYARFVTPYRQYQKAFPERGYHLRMNGVYFLGLDATGPNRHTRGRLDATILKTELEKARSAMQPGDMLVVAAHQPLAAMQPSDQENILIDAKETAAILSEYGTDVVLSGHVHFPIIATTQTSYPELQRSFILSGAGTAISHRIRPGAPNSFNRIQIDGKRQRIRMTRYDFADAVFAPVASTEFVLMDGGWKESKE